MTPGGRTSTSTRKMAFATARKTTRMTLDAAQCLGDDGHIDELVTGQLPRDAKFYGSSVCSWEVHGMLNGREMLQETA